MVIQILFRDPTSGTEQRYEFDQSPIRIGRNPLNNVVLEGNFVSGWHGIIRFDETGTYYFDLGSTNGTCLDGKRLQKNTPIAITKPTRLTIWMFELIVSPAQPGTATTPPPALRSSVVETLVGTGRLNMMIPPTIVPPLPPAQASAGAARIVSVGARTPPTAAGSPTPPQQETTLPLNEQTSARLIRCLRIIGAFSDAFMGLKKGYEQFGSEVGVRPLTGTTKLHRARTSQEIVEYLLDPTTDPDACARDLNAVFADMGIHDVALMEGITQSVRALLAKLDPNTQGMKVVASLWSGAKAKSKWNSYVESFNALLAEDTVLHAEIFGEEFASAYASVALGDEHAGKG
ncbi:MAG: FHA domain-containing protein [Deltaproteobacteria bacterium]|jgi:predicted component of type VI protein secretion system|nr:FHA domain-containing protein [Deltaproteobacteria bacterium]